MNTTEITPHLITPEQPDISIDYAEVHYRYTQEASNPDLSPIERQAKQDIADFAAKRHLEIAVENYMPNTIPHQLGKSALHR